MTMKTQTKFSFDTKLSADSVEWCPYPGLTNLFAVGTYQVQKEDDTSKEFSDDQRFGRIYLFAEQEENYELIHQIETRAVLDMKWSSSSAVPILAATTSSGQLNLYSKDLSQLASAEMESQEEKKPVVLSLDWNDRLHIKEGGLNLVTSDSNGSICLWSFQEGGSKLKSITTKKLHDFEAWIAAFDAWNENVAFSGGDDCKLIQTDFREHFPGKTIIGKNEHEAGVTSLLSDMHEEHRLYSGSYDEFLRVWDLRQPRQPLEKYHAEGGVWRIRQPRTTSSAKDFLGLACMHNGFQIVHKQGLKLHILYKEHDSLAYGLDFQADIESDLKLASCSFYDCLLKVWSVTKDLEDT